MLTNRNTPVSLALPFNDDLLKAGIHVNLALKLYEENVLTLTKAAKLALMSVEAFMELIANLDIVVVDQSAEELASDLDSLGE
nr:UPF0175 family protein [Pseudomaricurvus alcaniphilus]